MGDGGLDTVASLPTRPTSRPLVMGVVNVTPDSFSDGGRWFDADAAIAHGVELAEQGADLVDVGGESTRPGAARVEPDEELRRVVPVIRELTARGIRVSVDTMRAATARAAVEAGAEIINDVSAGLADEAMASVAAETGARYVAMHWRGHSDRMDSLAEYGDVAVEVRDELAARVDALVAAGVAADRIILDPGLGFAKRGEQNWQLLGRLDVLAGLGLPILVGASRKRFLGAMLPEGASVAERDLPTAVVSVLSAQAGAWGVRVHDVVATRRALDVLGAWQSGRRG
ncbi:dihydropteroate synthase [Agromyces endophyticus]|nr:dihydropteroate synthase [Agromyces sp. H17E-10]UOQ88176.1 dihydropteroate synthase [Agromyces sp. H17E-10]